MRCLPALLLAGCVAGPQILSPQQDGVELAATPFFPQERYQCGPAALATVLGASGVSVQPETLVPKVYLPERQGSLQVEMIAATRGYERVPYVLPESLDALLAELRAGRPVLVMQNLGWEFYPRWHYAVVIGYRPAADKLILRSGTTERLLMDTEDFLDDWDKAGRWAMVTLVPGDLPAAEARREYLRAVAGLEAAGKVDTAARGYRAAADRWPDEPGPWLGLGNTRHARGDLDGAVAAFRRALKIDPGLVVARNNLAQALAERGCKTAAERQIERALDEAPPDLAPAVRRTRDEIAAMPGGACSG
ncbi:hypothetical protein PC39_12892 [Salinisphaera sp. PC39]|uniref:PA2778 family cysteine peptidase n=1 Tax=Salinisphaera sp. PC39 TaxID=1304156 RepID=UPI00333E9212